MPVSTKPSHVEDGADDQRPEDADRHVALGVLGLLRRGRDGIEADVGEEDDPGAAQHAADAELTRAGVGRNEGAVRVARGDPMRRGHERHTGGDEDQDDRTLIATITLLTRADS